MSEKLVPLEFLYPDLKTAPERELEHARNTAHIAAQKAAPDILGKVSVANILSDPTTVD